MITFGGSYEIAMEGYTTLTHEESSAHTWWQSTQGDYAQVVFAINGLQSDLRRLEFFAMPAAVATYSQRKYIATNIYGTDSADWGNVTTILPAYMLTSTNGGWLLTLANNFKDIYFGGVTQTAASLYAYMTERYGNYTAFAYNVTTGGNLYYDFNNRLQNVVSGTYTMDYCENAPFVTFNPDSRVEFVGENYYCPDDITTNDAFAAFMIFGDRIYPTDYKCFVDIYFNGTSEPNISTKWAGYNGAVISNDDILKASNLHMINYAPADIQQTYTAFYTYIDSTDGYRKMNDEVYRRVNKMRTVKPVSPGQTIDTSYLSQVDGITGSMSSAAKIAEYGMNGIPEHIVWYLQVSDPEGRDSSLWELVIPKESQGNLEGYTLTELTDAKWIGAEVDLIVNIHDGTNPDDTGDDPPPPPPTPDPDPVDWTDDEGHGFPGDAVLTTTYSMTAAVLKNIGQKLWTQSYFDVLKIQSNPIENIVAVKWFPFDLDAGTSEEVVIGDVPFGINALKINTVKTIDIGSVTYTGPTGSFLDGSPYTTLKLNLPYVGQIQLDASEFRGKTIGVKYIVDLVTGECVARVSRAGIPLYDFPGHMGVDIVLTSTDRMQANMKAVSSGIHTAESVLGHALQNDVVGAVAGAATGALSIAGMDLTSQRVGSPSGVCGTFQNHKVWLTVTYPIYYQSDGYTHVFGRPCNRYLRLRGNFNSGDYIQVDKRTDLKIAMTTEENAELERLLTGGVYI